MSDGPPAEPGSGANSKDANVFGSFIRVQSKVAPSIPSIPSTSSFMSSEGTHTNHTNHTDQSSAADIALARAYLAQRKVKHTPPLPPARRRRHRPRARVGGVRHRTPHPPTTPPIHHLT